MAAPSTTDEFLSLVTRSELLAPLRLDEFLARRRAENTLPTDTLKLAQVLVFDGLLTKYQAEQLLGGRWRNFVIGGKYKLLERLGKGGMALVFLCEHQVMKRLVALKILPTAHAEDKELLGRFHREARALSQLRHPNIVGAYDVDYVGKVHFLVMEYVDGGDLDQMVQRTGPMAWERAAHYIKQAAHGLQHAHECGLVHRDVKPGNLLVDRTGTVKLLDLGLARIFHETHDDLTTGRDARTLLGTVDYLAPEQALNSHDVDIRADIYGLGATFYYLLTGKGLFEDGTVAQKLSWHLHRPPVPISHARPDVPEGLAQIIEIMLAKRADDRFQTPEEVDEALEPWTRTPIEPPSLEELPQLSRAARGKAQPSSVRMKISTAKTPTTTTSRPSDRISRATKILPSATSRPQIAPVAAPAPSLSNVEVPPPAPPPVEPPPARKARSWGLNRPLAAILVGMVALAAGGWFAFQNLVGGDPSGSTPKKLLGLKGAGTSPPERTALAVAPPADQAADASITLVSATSTTRAFPSLREAIRASKAGDRVVVKGSLLKDAVELSDADGAPKDLTIEGADPKAKGRPVRWRAPRDLGSGRALLDASGLEGFRLKGFVFDGQGRVAELVRLAGRGAGSTLEDLQFEGATRAGIVLRGWSGESERPTTIQSARFSTTDEVEAALLFEADPDRPTVASEWVRVVSSQFVGPFQADLMIAGPVEGLDVERCRFFQATDGLRYRRLESRVPLRARLANNTFADLQRGIHFETTPPAGSSELVVTNNLFSATTRIAMLDKVSVQPGRVEGRWIWTEEGKKSPSVPAGERQFRKVFDVARLPAKATLDISCDETFVVWLNGVEVARNPSPHFTQRVYAYDVTDKLRQGRNVLAVQGTNRLDRLDSNFGTAAALLAQITAREGSRDVTLVKTDESWKYDDQDPGGWRSPEFDDQGWRPVRPWPDDNVIWPWKFAVWDSTVFPQIKPPLEPIKINAVGNIRDYKSWEGYPTIDSERVAVNEVVLPRDPGNEARFLHYPKNHPLATGGPGGSPVGVSDDK